MLLHLYKSTEEMGKGGFPTQKKATGPSSSPQGEQWWQQTAHGNTAMQWLRCDYLRDYNKEAQRA